jgi:hypothetical protein
MPRSAHNVSTRGFLVLAWFSAEKFCGFSGPERQDDQTASQGDRHRRQGGAAESRNTERGDQTHFEPQIGEPADQDHAPGRARLQMTGADQTGGRQRDGVHVGQSGQGGSQVEAGGTEVLARGRDPRQDNRVQKAEDDRTLELRRRRLLDSHPALPPRPTMHDGSHQGEPDGHDQQGWQQRHPVRRRGEADFRQNPQEDKGGGDDADRRQPPTAGSLAAAAAGGTGRGGRAGNKAAKQARQQGAAFPAKEFAGQITGQADADDQHHHQPDGEGVEHPEVTHRLVRQHGQDHQAHQHQPRDLAQVVLTDAVHHRVQALLAVQQHHDGTCHHRGLQPVAEHDDDADREHDQHRHLGGQADVRVLLLALAQVAEDDHGGKSQETRGNDPAAEGQANQAGEGAKQGQQRKGADTRHRIAHPFPLQTHQKTQGKRGGQGLQHLGGGRQRQGRHAAC